MPERRPKVEIKYRFTVNKLAGGMAGQVGGGFRWTDTRVAEIRRSMLTSSHTRPQVINCETQHIKYKKGLNLKKITI